MAQLQPGQYDLNTGLSGDEIDVCAADANSDSVIIWIGKCDPASFEPWTLSQGRQLDLRD